MDWLERASLAYYYAFDLCAARISTQPGRCLVLPSGEFYAREAWLRLLADRSGSVDLGDAAAILVDQPDAANYQLVTSLDQVDDVQTVLWAEPERAQAAAQIAQIRRLLRPHGRLAIIYSQPLVRFLPEYQQGLLTRDPLPRRDLLELLRQQGFIVEEQHGFHGPAAIGWGYLHQYLTRFGRLTLADRCWFQMRAAFRADGWQRFFALVSLMWATKTEDL